jgi:hypothetical protein
VWKKQDPARHTKKREIENKRAKMHKMKHSGKTFDKKTVKMMLVTVDTPEEEPEKVANAELSDDDDDDDDDVDNDDDDDNDDDCCDYGDYAEVSDKEITNVTEYTGSFAVGDFEKGDFILVKLAGIRSISHIVAETVNYFRGYEYKIWDYKWLDDTSKFITVTENEYFSILSSDTLQKLLPTIQAESSKCQALQLYFPADFSALNLK